jgi:hypothetical protein
MASVKEQEEVRFWDRVGMYVTRDFADQWIDRIGASGQLLDGDLEEFTQVVTPDTDLIRKEIEDLFQGETNQGNLSPENVAIVASLNFESKRKAFVLEIKERLISEGVDEADALSQAKEEYDMAKDLIVREALGLPEEEE